MGVSVLFLLPGVVPQVMHVLLVFIHDGRGVVQLHLQVHHLDKRQTNVLEATLMKRRGNPQHKSWTGHTPAASGRSTSRWT